MTLSISSFAQDAEELVLKAEKTNILAEKGQLFHQIALKYQLNGVHTKAIEFFEKYFSINSTSFSNQEEVEYYQQIGVSYFALRSYKQCTAALKKVLEANNSSNDITSTKQTLVQLINVSKLDADYKAAISYCEQLLDINKHLSDYKGMFINYNNIGILYKKVGEPLLSKEYFTKALEILDKIESTSHNDVANATIFLNVAADYTQNRDYAAARDYYKRALDIYNSNGKKREVALVQNYLALNEFLSNNLIEADIYIKQAIKIGEQGAFEDVLINSYKIISDITLAERKLKDYVQWNEKYTILKEKIDRNYLKLEQELLQKQYEAEMTEGKFRLMEVEQEKQRLTLDQIRLEKEKQLKEIELLKHLQELQETKIYKEKLERQKVEQLLALAEQRNLSAKQKSEIAELQKERHLQEVELLQKTLIEKDNIKKVELLKRDKKIKDSELVSAKNERNQLVIIIMSTVGLALMLIMFLYHNRTINQKLLNKNREIQIKGEEIETQNEELQQRQEEILSQRDLIEEKNTILTLKNNEIEQQSEELKLMNEKVSEINLYLEKLVEEKTLKLQTTNIELDTLLYRTSHDFRRPLTSIMGLVELAKMSMKEKENMWIIDKLSQVCQEQDKMLEKIKVLSEIERFVIDNQEIHLAEIIERILFEFKSHIKATKTEVQIKDETEEKINLPETLIGIIIKYLVENAISFGNPRNPSINLVFSVQNNNLHILISDNGQGIPEPYQPKVFDMYYRANENSKGNGLGLYVVKKAVEKLDGRVAFTSTVAIGTTFRVAIPLKLV